MIALLPSITSAVRIKRILERQGIKAELIQTTKDPDKPRCGHGIKVSDEYLNVVYDAAKTIGSAVKAVYYE